MEFFLYPLADTKEWSYIGESGCDIASRNSHSLSIVYGGEGVASPSFLVIFGGASPEHGPFDDTYFAELPNPSAIGKWIRP